MGKTSKKIDLIYALIMNIVFLVIYVGFFELIQESNDDLAMSFLAEGVYGEYTGYMVFENVLWGKLIVFLNQLIPAVKWYNVLHYVVIFLAFVELTYVFIRKQGRKMGMIVSSIMLVFCGYESYVMFQFSRVTAIGTIAGIVMLYYALEAAEDKMENHWCLGAGAFLTIWSSMLRFQMFALCVALTLVCLAIYKMWTWIKVEKRQDWLKQLGIYAGVYALVGLISIGFYAVDRAHYYSDDEWTEYLEYNELRANLWDTGFPDYYENMMLYEELGIGEYDYSYYKSWEMDEEVLTKETLQTIVNAKEKVEFDLGYFFEYYPRDFLNLTLFIVFIVLSIVAWCINKKNLYFVLFEGGAVFLVELVFFHMRRFGWERVDNGMWMAAIIILLYGMSDDLKKIVVNSWKWMFAAASICMLLNAMDLRGNDHFQKGIIGSTKAFYQQVMQDDEHLYIILAAAPSPYYAYDFWEPCGYGDLTNTYNAFGWEYNLGLKKQALVDFGIENIYRDSINNDKVYFVAGTQVETLQRYIQENYDETAFLSFEKEYMGVAIWSVRTLDTVVDTLQ
ncbi:MAG: hypothetical protein IJP06_03255 [Agathobacter sp.]|nr:hypothetical protein [Agathobacter sp.]